MSLLKRQQRFSQRFAKTLSELPALTKIQPNTLALTQCKLGLPPDKPRTFKVWINTRVEGEEARLIKLFANYVTTLCAGKSKVNVMRKTADQKLHVPQRNPHYTVNMNSCQALLQMIQLSINMHLTKPIFSEPQSRSSQPGAQHAQCQLTP
jgi:hypothetical protein